MLYAPVVMALAACSQTSDSETHVDAASPATDPDCGDSGFLTTALYGSIEHDLDWQGGEVHCESMRRPDGKGMRMRFTGDVGQERVAIILAMPGLERGRTGNEVPTVVTFMVEGSGRFFSTPNLGNCWSDIARQDLVAGGDDRYDLAGTLYCVAPLGEINGDAAIAIPELSFRGIVDWSAS